ncbi:MAG: hypothetical protein WCJ23_07190, partial [Verrucomicrobiota bacterium]
EKFLKILRPYQLLNSSQKATVEKSLGEKLWTCTEMLKEVLQSLEKQKGIITITGVYEMGKKLDIDFTQEEIDYGVLMMYKEHRNIEHLPYEYLLKLANKVAPNDSENQEPVEEKKEEPFHQKTPFRRDFNHADGMIRQSRVKIRRGCGQDMNSVAMTITAIALQRIPVVLAG